MKKGKTKRGPKKKKKIKGPQEKGRLHRKKGGGRAGGARGKGKGGWGPRRVAEAKREGGSSLIPEKRKRYLDSG